MAGKNIVIDINYNVTGVPSITQVEQAAKRAETATNSLKQSSQSAGTTMSQSFANSGLTIESMKLKLAQLKAQIELTNKSDTKRLSDLSKQYNNILADINKLTKAYITNAKESQKAATIAAKAAQDQANTNKQLIGQFGELANAVKLFITAGLVREVVQTSLEMAKLSGNVEGVERAFNRAFPNAESLLANLVRSTHGAVTEFDLMKRTLQATNLGVAVEQLPILFEFAATRAQQTGESVDYLVDSIVRGIGRKSILVLDNLGLSATRLKEQFNGASLASQSVADVTKGVAEIARVELEKMGGYAETSATKVDQLSASWTNLGIEISKLATQDGGLIETLKEYTEAFRILIAAQNEGKTVQEKLHEERIKEGAQFRENLLALHGLNGTTEENRKVLQDNIAELTKSIGAWAKFRDQMNENIDVLKEQIDDSYLMSGAIRQQIIQTERLRDANKSQAEEDQELLKLLQQRLTALDKLNKMTEQLGLIAAKEEQIKAVTDALPDAKTTGEIERLNSRLAILNGELADLKAFGTTKITIDGKIRPVTDPKDLLNYKVQTENKLGELGIKAKVTLDTPKPDSAAIFLNDVSALLEQIPNNIPVPLTVTPVTRMTEWEKIAEEFANNWREIVSQGLMDTTSVITSIVQAEADSYDQRLGQLRAFYDNQMILAGDNERAKDQLRLREQREERKLRQQAFEADKSAKRSTTVINGAAGVINAFATLPYPAAVVASLLIAAQTAAQIAVINSQKPRFKDGVIDLKGPGTTRSDSIDAKLSRGESVMTADETRKSMGILKSIRAGKLDDQIISKLQFSSSGVIYKPMDDSRIVAAIERQRYPDIVRIGSTVYEAKKDGETYTKFVRSKSMSK